MATIITKNSSTASSVPSAAQLVQGELAVNVADKRLFTENSSGTVVELGTNPSSLTLPNGTANGLAFLNASKVLTTGSALTFDGTNLDLAYSSSTNKGRFASTSAGDFFIYGINGAAIIYDADGDNHVWKNSGSEQMRLTSTGLGIGTSSPGYKLDVNGIINNTSAIYWGNGAGKLQFSGSDAYIDATGALILRTGGSNERARIDSSGNLLVNRTGTDGSAVLQVATKNNYGIGIASGVTTTQYVLEFRNANGVVGTVTTSGTTTAYNTSSDYRLKENIQPMTGALAKVAALKPCTYKWKADGSDGEGFIAHELQAVVPDCVTGEKDAVDAEGNPQYQGIDTSFLAGLYAAAIQELKAELDAAKARIAALEAPSNV
jgi:hypothetical protein